MFIGNLKSIQNDVIYWSYKSIRKDVMDTEKENVLVGTNCFPLQ